MKDADEIICYCSNITKRQIMEAAANGAATLKDIREMTKACTVGRCEEMNPKKRCCSGDIIKLLKKNAAKGLSSGG